jgi:CHASE3 domain sensor protein
MATLRSLQFRDRLNYGLLVIAVILILMTSVISVHSTRSLRDSIERVHEARVMKEAISDFRISSGEDEAFGLRFLITGLPEFFTQYQSQTKKMEAKFQRLVVMAQESSIESALVQRLIKLHAMRTARFQEVTALKFADMRDGTHTKVAVLKSLWQNARFWRR